MTRMWPAVSLLLAIAVVPVVLARLLFDVNQFEVGFLLALLGLLVWLLSQGAGWRSIGRYTAALVRDPLLGLSVSPRQSYLYIPLLHKVEAILPTYPFRFEFLIEKIDTQTPALAQIGKIRIRLDCVLKDQRYKQFFEQSASRLHLLRRLEEKEKLKRTDPELWERFLYTVLYDIVDDVVRDVVWTWSDPASNDPYGLSQKRRELAQQVEAQLIQKLSRWEVRLIVPVVFEMVEISEDIIKRKTRSDDRERDKATHEASLEAVAIMQKGFAEAEVRARALGLILDELIQKRGVPLNDPLIAQVVRAALYSDGEMIWKGVIEKSANGNGTTKAA